MISDIIFSFFRSAAYAPASLTNIKITSVIPRLIFKTVVSFIGTYTHKSAPREKRQKII